jgi:ribonuclease J
MWITIHRGTKVIGGSCVELAAGETRLVLDLGLPLVDGDREPFDSRAALRKSTEALVADGTAPRVAGLFDDKSPAPHAILLSHAHGDHAGLLHRSRPTVPIYATTLTSKMMFAGSVFAMQNALDRPRFEPVRSGRSFSLGDFRITPLAVDHSVCGSVAFLVEAEGKRILYSGDFRLHGRKRGMFRDLVACVRKKPLDAAIVEGTQFGRGALKGSTERQLEMSVTELVRASPGLVLATFSPLDVDRLVTMYKAARKAGRVFVADAYAAFVLHQIHREIAVPRAQRKAGMRVYFNHSFTRRKIAKLEKLFAADRIELDEILAQPKKHLMVLQGSMVRYDFGGRLPQGCHCLYSRWEGYLKKPAGVALQEKVAEAGGEFTHAHVSGHAYVADIIRFVNDVNARMVIPIHTFEPQMFGEHFPNVTRLSDGVPFELT